MIAGRADTCGARVNRKLFRTAGLRCIALATSHGATEMQNWAITRAWRSTIHLSHSTISAYLRLHYTSPRGIIAATPINSTVLGFFGPRSFRIAGTGRRFIDRIFRLGAEMSPTGPDLPVIRLRSTRPRSQSRGQVPDLIHACFQSLLYFRRRAQTA